MKKREKVGVTVLSSSPCYGEWFPEKLVDAIAWLNELLEEIPEEHRSQTIITVESETDYDGHNPRVVIAYRRPETDEEMADRIRREKQGEEYRKARELETLKRLQEKYKDAKP